MQEVIKKLHDTLEIAQVKLADIHKKEIALENREQNISKREIELDERDKDLDKRREAIMFVENIVEAEKRVATLSEKTLKERETLMDDCVKFKHYRDTETAKLNNRDEELKQIQRNINKGLAELEKRKEDYKKEVLLELAKK